MTATYDVLRELTCATVREVAARLGVKYSTARTYLKRLVDKGLAEKRGVGHHMLYCVAKDATDVAPRGAYKLYTATRKRLLPTLELLGRYGCISVSALMQTLGVTHTQAYHLMRVLLLLGMGVKVRIGNTAILCRDRVAAEEAISRLRGAIHRIATENNMRYVSATKVLQTALKDRATYELLSRFIPLRRSMEHFPPLVLTFVNDILQSLYGKPLRRRHGRIYAVTPQPRVYTPDVTDSADKYVVRVNLPEDLAALLSADVNEIVLQAVEQLLARFRT
jgi:DNA-binding transcriptional ArsR family regulator